MVVVGVAWLGQIVSCHHSEADQRVEARCHHLALVQKDSPLAREVSLRQPIAVVGKPRQIGGVEVGAGWTVTYVWVFVSLFWVQTRTILLSIL